MKASLLLLLAAALGCASVARAQVPFTHPNLTFAADGTFKILQISDVHYQNGASTGCQNILDSQKPCSDLNSTAWMTNLLAKEKPNLVVFTGDNIWYPGNKNVTAAILALTKPVETAKIPFMVTFGNHDCEEDGKPNNPKIRDFTCRKGLVNTLTTATKWSLTKAGPSNLNAVANYAYTITDPKTKTAGFVIYILDGGAYFTTPSNISGYDYITPEQAAWYTNVSKTVESTYKKKLPAAMFYHIPVPEFDTAWACGQKSNASLMNHPSFRDFGPFTSESGMGSKAKDSCNPSYTIKGDYYEGVYSAHQNGGLFSAVAARGDVKFMGVGHDHVNDFCADLMKIKLCYGGGFGYYAYGKAGWPRRARVYTVKADGSVKTYKRLDAWSSPAYAIKDEESF